MKKIVLKLYEFDELSKDSQERIIEREHWNVMEQCMDAYGIDYKKSMKAFEDMTDTRVYNWEVGYERYDFSYEFKYKDPIYEHPTDYHRDIFPENLCGKLLFRYINNNIMPYIIKGKYFSTSGKYKVFYVGYNMSDDGSMAFITSQLELIKEVIEKYKKVRTSLSYRDVWGVFRSLMDYIEFFNMGTPKSLLKKMGWMFITTR